MHTVNNILANQPDATQSEVFETLARGQDVVIERIVSRGQRSAEGFWYEQEREEFVMVVTGRATLRRELEGRVESIDLGPGDCLTIPALQRHRVEWTDPEQPTVWLAIHYPPCR
ncbi:MAG: cupin domain-containing protein [Gammaproteobacteria bacterium]|nr:cupin domain-containing protein [Gammaproteobacteria bacterium]